MKLSKIGALCKAYKRFVVYNVGHGMQWISDGYAAYPLCDLPPLEEDNVFAIFDIPEDKRGKMYFDERQGVPVGMSFADAVQDEVEIKPYSIGIIWQGAIYYPCKSREGILFVDKKYLSPFEDGVVLYERWAENGTPYIAAKRGMLLEGVDVVKKSIGSNLSREKFASSLESERADEYIMYIWEDEKLYPVFTKTLEK